MRVASLFAGAGGLDLGFVTAGHQIVWANDFDADAVATYRHNIGDHIVHGDIAQVDVATIPDVDLIVGGFPCQGFSRANMRRHVGDERNKLYREFVRVVDGKRPPFFLAENVRGILSLEGGSAFRKIVADFEAIGYRVEHHVVNAADYGVPQQRWRVFLVGRRMDIPASVAPTFPEPTHSQAPTPTSSRLGWLSIGEALSGLPDPDTAEGRAVPNHVYSRYKFVERDFTGHRTTNPSRPSPTILARGNGGGGVCAIPHPGGQRRMSVRESAIAQTFPVDFVFLGALNSMYRQVGNAVPVRLAEQIAASFARVELPATQVAA